MPSRITSEELNLKGPASEPRVAPAETEDNQFAEDKQAYNAQWWGERPREP